MGVQQTSIQAYTTIRHLGAKQLAVLNYIFEHPDCTNKEIARGLGWEINCITGRNKELRDMGYVVNSGVVKQLNDKLANTWRCKLEVL